MLYSRYFMRRIFSQNMKVFFGLLFILLLIWLAGSLDLTYGRADENVSLNGASNNNLGGAARDRLQPGKLTIAGKTPSLSSQDIMAEPDDPISAPPANAGSHHISRDKVSMVGNPAIGNDFPLETLRLIYATPLTGDSKAKIWNSVRKIPRASRKRILVTGGAGFVGSHLVDRLMLMGHYVIVVDNFFTGNRENVLHWEGHPQFELRNHDVVDPLNIEVDQIYHLACPASPPHYQYNPIKTLKTSVLGTIHMLGLAKRVKARFLLTSTSEVYGDPKVHPQTEQYWGNVNPIGPRACYDEGKRVAETFTYAYEGQVGADVRVARIFNTFGPRMHENDGRVVSNFIIQAIKGKDITVYGSGKQTRSFQYVHDLVDGLISLMNGNYTHPVNLGNPDEFTIQEFANFIKDRVNAASSSIVNLPATKDDPQVRQPDITVAKTYLKWEPRFSVQQGIDETVEYFSRRIKEDLALSRDL